MRIAILSDSHDHVWNLQAALGALPGQADALVHCGDLCAPFIVPMLAGFPGPVHAVFGNNDADRFRLQANAARTDNVVLHGEFAALDLGGKAYAVQHFDALGRALAESCRYDVVCYGHNHRHHIERVGEVWLVNPGAVMGWVPGGVGDVDPTFVIHDTEADTLQTWVIREGGAAPGEAAPATP